MVPHRISSPSFSPFPHPQEPVAHRSPHGLRPGKDGLEATLRSRFCGLRGQVGAAPPPAGCGGRCPPPGPQPSPSPRAPASPPLLPGRRERPALVRLGTEPPQAHRLRNSPRFPWSACVRITGRFSKSAEAGVPRAAGGPGSLHSQRAARAASQARAVLSSADRGCGRLCGGRGRPAAPCGAARPRTLRPWPLPGRTPREGTARIPAPPSSRSAPAFTP